MHRSSVYLSEEGFVFALDDFGTGYSSLSYLHNMPVQLLKIDRSFILGLGMTIATGSVVPQIVSMARQLNMVVIAEGVETAQQAQALSDLAVQYAQGWLYDQAMPISDIHKKLYLNQQQRISIALPDCLLTRINYVVQNSNAVYRDRSHFFA
ncbi:EAL domain-containing protein [Yersinia intermedia]|uniref:EAL domain-containing protein n=1 Tax=Yersinia intermedia TaxID=631 RepID=UPI0022FF1160|nr:EAL domain-containing protein [Yersinia intermedia]MDA5483258.1 EAL domain-containing protein [Yersinia intermedia]